MDRSPSGSTSSEGRTRTSRASSAAFGLGALLVACAAGLALHATSPPTGSSAAESYLFRARDILGALPPGTSTPTYPGSTAWVAYPLAAVQGAVHALVAPDVQSVAEFLDATSAGWRAGLRGFWCAVAGAVAGLLYVLGRRCTGTTSTALAAAAGLGAALLFVLARASALGVASLSPGIPAGLLVLVVTARLLRPREDLRGGRHSVVSGLWLGALLAWAPFDALLVPLFLVVAGVVGRSAGVVGRTALVTVLAAFALEPARVLDLGAGLEGIGVEWAREGGLPFEVARSGTLLSFALLDSYLGPVALAAAGLGAIGWWRTGSRALAGWSAGVWIMVVALPAGLGVRVPAAAQLSIAPLVSLAAAGGVVFVGRFAAARESERSGAWVPAALLAAAVLGFAAAPRFAQRGPTVDLEALAGRMTAELGEVVGTDPWLLDRPLPGGQVLPRHALVLPRDTRAPERFDFVYWPRWYAGFSHVLVSHSEIRRQGLRPAAALPRHFYGSLRESARVVGRWGSATDGSGALYTLFEIPDGTEWSEPLQPEEIAALQPVPELGSFLSQLGSTYGEAGMLREAAIVFEQGIDLVPDALPLYNNLAAVYMMEGEFEAAARTLAPALERNPRSFELLFSAGKAYSGLGAHGRAEQLLRRAVQARPDVASAHYELGRTFLAQQKHALARMAFERYLELEPRAANREQLEATLSQLEEILAGNADGDPTAPSGP